jgi:hypothetical protein
MELAYFTKKTEQFAANQGRYSDAEFPEKFRAFISEIPDSRSVKKQLLLILIETTKTLYENHLKKMTGNCQPYCQFTVAYKRGIPFAEAELKKINRVNLFFDKVAEAIKNSPIWLLKKIPSWLIGTH